MSAPTPATGVPDTQQIYRVALASIVGSVIEQYDYLVTGVIAATVWGEIFFKLPGLAARLRLRHHHPPGRRLHLRPHC